MKHRAPYVVQTTRIVSDPASNPPAETIDRILDSQTPLGEEEQEVLLHEFNQLQWSNNRHWRIVFGALGALLCAFFLWAASSQYLEPFGQRWTGELRSAVHWPRSTSLGSQGRGEGQEVGGDGAEKMTGLLGLQTVSVALAAAGLLLKLPRKGELERGCMPASLQQRLFLALGLFTSCLAAAGWLLIHWAMIQLHGYKLGARWDLIWVPAIPVLYCLLTQWVVWALGDTGAQIKALQGMRYDLKQA